MRSDGSYRTVNEERSACRSYDDIIDMPHHVSDHHSHMSVHDRAAQFAPFAALTGHGAAIAETARLTEEKRELCESQKEVLDQRLVNIMHNAGEPYVKVEYFVDDERKSGGRYVTVFGRIKKIDDYRHVMVLEAMEKQHTESHITEILLDDIYDIQDISDEDI